MIIETYKGPLLFAAAIIVALLIYGVLTLPDQRNTTEKIGDAIHDLPQGVDKAERQLHDRTPGQKLGDAVKDTGDKIKDGSKP